MPPPGPKKAKLVGPPPRRDSTPPPQHNPPPPRNNPPPPTQNRPPPPHSPPPPRHQSPPPTQHSPPPRHSSPPPPGHSHPPPPRYSHPPPPRYHHPPPRIHYPPPPPIRPYRRSRARRITLGEMIILALFGTHLAYKFRSHDIVRIENYYGRPAEELTEEEIIEGMRHLGINHIDLDDYDRSQVYQYDDEYEQFTVNRQRYCIYCGDIIEIDEIYCSNCGQKL